MVQIMILEPVQMEKRFWNRSKISQIEQIIKEIECHLIRVKIPVKKGKITRKIRSELERLVENQKYVLPQSELFSDYRRQEDYNLMSSIAVQALRKLSHSYGVDFTSDEVAIVVPYMNRFAMDIITEISEILRFATIYTRSSENGDALSEEILNRSGLSVRIVDFTDETCFHEKLLIRIHQHVEFELLDKHQKFTQVLFDLPDYMEPYRELPAREIFEIAACQMDAKKLFGQKKVKIRGLK